VSRSEHRRITVAATICAAVVLAGHLAGKAARDAIFLQRFPVTNLPLLLAVSSALSIAVTFLFARRLSRGVPARVVRFANAGSALMFVVEWSLLESFPRPVATIIYMHQMLLGPLLVSGFWSIVSECFDPRTARRVVGTIGTGATIGGLAGAVLAERVAATLGTPALLPVIAGLQLVATWRLGALARVGTAAVAVPDHPKHGELKAVITNLVRVSLLRRLATIAVTMTIAAALLDYVFKASVTREVSPDDLARLFATFHGVVGLLTAIVAWALGRRALRSWGLVRTLATLPGAVIVLGTAALAMPSVVAFVALRGTENVLRNSLYRQSYEVFYTPLLPQERRATKTVIDVGVERFGDVLGGLSVLAILALATDPSQALLVGAITLALLGVIVALHAQRSYVEALERSLHTHATELGNHDAPTRMKRAQRDRGTRPKAAPPGRWRFQRARRSPPDPDPRLGRLDELSSEDPERIRQALAGTPLSQAAVAYAIPLLGRADVADDASRALAEAARGCVGQLIDAVRDPRFIIGVRARLPALIASAGGDLARSGLLECLGDPDFEVRYAAAHALLELREHDPQLHVDHAEVFDGVRRELAVEPARWSALDAPTAIEGNGLSRAAQHLATLLSLALPAEPIKTAFHGLWSEDLAFRGVALEYLDNVLPGDIRDRMWSVLSIEAPAAAKRPVEDVRAELLRSQLRTTPA